MNQPAADAQDQLRHIEQAKDKARRLVLFKGADALYMVWGAIWVIGFIGQHFLPPARIRFGHFSMPASNLIWTPLVLVGIIATLVLFKRRTPVDTSESRAIGIFWGALFGYFYLWMYLLSPLFKWDSVYAHEGERIMSAVIVTVPMFAYVVMGLWGCGQYMIWLGLGITALTVLGLYAFPSFFYLWMAAVGGGALFGVGIIARRQWKKA